MKFVIYALAGLCSTLAVNAFISPAATLGRSLQTSTSVLPIKMSLSDDEELRKQSRALRKPGANDRVAEVNKPLGMVLEEDERGDVYVADVIPGGNAARTGKIFQGDKVVMISATFGEEVWSTRGVGIGSVMNAVKVRSGNSVKVVLESTAESKQKAQEAAMTAAEIRAARAAEEEKNRQLLAELDATDDALRKKKWRLW
uniref:PDZ domain-containing protein n=1 Tax=Fibrocapsa japonica TaxID=94617 RepID=A0A6U1P4I4_9STRA|mmetsp:Transcript_24092/g.35010  ORF Transcript_24092/g.35010 Transcript_24092/m.35010 type:complete len:200 (+) Transcript_24092:84-683(+)|eukprot:CAMPEP_0113933860 /NCGR_PEP_ID=MMETSP1339-20121228/1178_1 /TAXON_ID=94617 /ORGANISM="Fibrocapsa japonica" /LENGTH=199 /DNA_ID=CAMNT_0000935361 /DNA_START=84 /DNA_END=680 /DNA_ORIENTATION=+ /assembly_acc=CAM_ASM_000762